MLTIWWKRRAYSAGSTADMPFLSLAAQRSFTWEGGMRATSGLALGLGLGFGLGMGLGFGLGLGLGLGLGRARRS